MLCDKDNMQLDYYSIRNNKRLRYALKMYNFQTTASPELHALTIKCVMIFSHNNHEGECTNPAPYCVRI